MKNNEKLAQKILFKEKSDLNKKNEIDAITNIIEIEKNSGAKKYYENKVDEHKEIITKYLTDASDKEQALLLLCKYMSTEATMLEYQVKNKTPMDNDFSTMGYHMDSIGLAIECAKNLSYYMIKDIINPYEKVSTYDFIEGSYFVKDYYAEVPEWIKQINETTGNLSQALSIRNIDNIYKEISNLTVIRSNIKFFTYWLRENMPTQR